MGYSWRIGESYVKISGRWAYLYRAIDKTGRTVHFYHSSTRDGKAGNRFVGEVLWGLSDGVMLHTIDTDKAPAYPVAINELKQEEKCPESLVHRQLKCLNHSIEAGHSKLKRGIKPMLGFKCLKTACATTKGLEPMPEFRNAQLKYGQYDQGGTGQIRLNTTCVSAY